MKLKNAILTTIDRDTLEAVTENLEMEIIDRRNPKAMHAGVAYTRRVAPEIMQCRYSDIRRVRKMVVAQGSKSYPPRTGLFAAVHNRRGVSWASPYR